MGLGNNHAFAGYDDCLTLDDKQHMKNATAHSGRIIDAGAELYNDDTPDDRIIKVLSGWGMSYLLLSNGTRVVTDFILPGEHLLIRQIRASRETVVAATPVVISETLWNYDAAAPEQTRENDPAMNIVIARHARLVERMAAIGGLGAFERTAYLLLELAIRSGLAKTTGNYSYVLPVTQSDLADALGLTNVHINRVLKELRLKNLISVSKNEAKLNNVKYIIKISNFNRVHF